MHKQAEITEQSKQNLIEAFWSIYMTKRIDKITVKEITSKAGYNRELFTNISRIYMKCWR